LLLRRWQAGREWIRDETKIGDPQVSGRWPVFLLFVLFGFLYLPTRLVEEATPEWRPIEWALGIEAIGLTLCAVFLGKGRGWLRQVAFPICFFLVAIPWPTIIEAPVIQSLTRINSAIVVELLGWAGIPALQHGNLIEVSTGTVGVSEACSGIRSFQTSLMISLFFGEFYSMGLLRRLLLVPAGFVLAMAFNVCRMSFLTVVAAKKGVEAIAQYHDPAGIMITIICTAGLWGLAVLFKSANFPAPSHRQPAVGSDQKISPPITWPAILRRLGLVLLLWLVAVEVGTEFWYRSLESHLAPSPQWSVTFPTDNPTFKILPISADTQYLLRFDEAKQAAWIDADGSRWNTFYCSWWPGRVAGYLAKRHTPEICLPATGQKMLSGPDLTMMKINGVTLPVRSYVFETENGLLYVFHCRWEAGVNEDAYVTHESARFNLIRGIWAGRGKQGQKILEIILSGYSDSDQAKAAFARHLQTMITVEKPVAAQQKAEIIHHNALFAS
jgi:exosortase